MSRKRTAETYESDDGFVEDAPSSKKSRNAESKQRNSKTAMDLKMQKNKDGGLYWDVSPDNILLIIHHPS